MAKKKNKKNKAKKLQRQNNLAVRQENQRRGRRVSGRQLRYKAAEIARREGWTIPRYYDGEEANAKDRQLMTRIARDMYGNNAIYQAIIDNLCTAIIGEDGVEVSPTLLDPELAAGIKSEWTLFEEFADDTGRENLTGLERQIATEYFNVGEVLLLKNRKKNTVQVIESERIKEVITENASSNLSPDPNTPRYASGAYVGFEIYTDSHKSDTVIVPASDAIYLSLTRRPSQVRGCGILWGCVDFIEMMMLILRNEAKAMDVLSRFALIVQRNERMYNTDDDEDGEISDEEDLNNRFFELGQGTIFFGKQGEEVRNVDHNGVPSNNLDGTLLVYLRIISAVIGADAATFILGDFSKTNYSSNKAAAIALSRTINKHQNKFRHILYRPLYRWQVGRMIAAKIINPGKYGKQLFSSVKFVLPKLQSIDEQKEAATAKAQLETGLCTHKEILLKQNKDQDEFFQERKAEIIKAATVAREIEKETDGLVLAKEIIPTLVGLPVSKTAMATNPAQPAA